MKNYTLYLGALLISAFTLISLSSCSAHRQVAQNLDRKIASTDVDLTAPDLQCYRDVQKAYNHPTDFPWGYDGPIVFSIGEAWSERYGTSDEYDAENKHAIVKFYPQYGQRFALLDGDLKLMVELPPYSNAGVQKNCPGSEDESIDLIEIVGKRYLVAISGAGFFSAIYDPVTFKSMTPHSPDRKFDQCLYKESRRQALQYKGWEKDILNHGVHLNQVNVEGKTPFLPTKNLPAEFKADVIHEANKGFMVPVSRAFSDFQNRVKDLKVKMRSRTGAPYFEEDKTPPPSDDLIKSLDVASCEASPHFQPMIESVKKQIKDCADAYPHLHLDCSQ